MFTPCWIALSGLFVCGLPISGAWETTPFGLVVILAPKRAKIAHYGSPKSFNKSARSRISSKKWCESCTFWRTKRPLQYRKGRFLCPPFLNSGFYTNRGTFGSKSFLGQLATSKHCIYFLKHYVKNSCLAASLSTQNDNLFNIVFLFRNFMGLIFPAWLNIRL